MTEEFDFRGDNPSADENDFEARLRPVRFEDFAGQEKIMQNLKVFVEAATMRNEALDHVL
ncbi:MAG: Holliday junction branch migration DNA helicase RuvB, partial [Bacteroidales bacterium]|nr:Holliday junction branch migration DNA helicase RuvB [Bacteroidales bacterium]